MPFSLAYIFGLEKALAVSSEDGWKLLIKVATKQASEAYLA
jgi:hypothetical protein